MGRRVARKTTPIGTEQAAKLLTQALLEYAPEIATEALATNMLAYSWFECGAGRSINNYNWGNISCYPSQKWNFWRPPWYDLGELSENFAEKNPTLYDRYVTLHSEMKAGKVPQAFRAYASHVDGVEGYVRFLCRERYKPFIEAMASDDPEQVGAQAKATSYCPDCIPSVVERNVRSFVKSFRERGLFDSLPKAREGEAAQEPGSQHCSPLPWEDGLPFERSELERGLDAELHILRNGSHGSLVTLFQAVFLFDWYEGRVDGIFGPITESAVRALQGAAGITSDGWVGIETWTAVSKQ